MGRKVSYASKIKLRKCDKVCNYLAKRDRISELPDEVVISILSCLTLKEATKTSVLSHRWEKLWTFTTGILDFDGTETLIGMELEELEYQRVNYTDWVNRVLKLHEGHSIDEFRILFDLESSSSPDINNWIEFALLKGVKRLELDLRSWVRCRFNEKKFTFLAIEKSAFCAKRKVGSSVVSCFRPLTAITLKGVNIAQEVLDYFFLNCPLLERLSVIDSKDVVNLKVSGPLLKLKYLEISNCSEITSIEISAANLASFMYSGPKIDLLMKNVPRLVELSLGCQYPGLFIEQIWKHISYLSQLEKLSVELDDDVRVPLHFPEFKNLTELEIFSMTSDYHTLLWITSFIGSCPSLRKFAIKLAFYEFSPRKSVAHMFKEKRKREAQRARKCRHECLKEVELKGFRGRRTYVELAMSLLKTAVSLEKIIIDTRLQFRLHQNLPRDRVKSHDGTQEYRESAMKLKEKVPVGVRCVVL